MPAVGLEPTRVISSTDFESVTSANSITPALEGFLPAGDIISIFPPDVKQFFQRLKPSAETGVKRATVQPPGLPAALFLYTKAA